MKTFPQIIERSLVMNKRILSILLCLMLVVSLLVLAVPVNAAPSSVDLTITADKTEAKPGDTVNFTVTLGPVSELGGFAFKLSIPDGLTFVEGSSKLTATKASLGFDDLYFDEAPTYQIGGVASEADYESTSDTEIGTFQCTVNDDASGTQTVSATIDPSEWFSCQTWEQWGENVKVGDADVTIAGATEAPATEAPATEAPATDAPATDAPATEAHVHDNPLRHVEEVPATYETEGTKAYYICDSCGQKFWDAFAQNKIDNDDELVIPKLTPTEPVTDAPATEAPATEAPATEEPATEEPATETPATEEPATETPATETPATEEPTTVEPTTEPGPTEAGKPVYEFEKNPYEYDLNAGGDLQLVVNNVNTNLPNDAYAHFTKIEINGVDFTSSFKDAGGSGALQMTIPGSAITSFFPNSENEVKCYFDDADEPAVTIVKVSGIATADESTKDSSGDSASSTSAGTTSPKTGDSTHMYLWLLIMLASLAGACGVVYTAKRKGIFTK